MGRWKVVRRRRASRRTGWKGRGDMVLSLSLQYIADVDIGF